MQHEQVLGPGHEELQVTRPLQTRRHEAQKLLNVDVGQRAADDGNYNSKRTDVSQARRPITAAVGGEGGYSLCS